MIGQTVEVAAEEYRRIVLFNKARNEINNLYCLQAAYTVASGAHVGGNDDVTLSGLLVLEHAPGCCLGCTVADTAVAAVFIVNLILIPEVRALDELGGLGVVEERGVVVVGVNAYVTRNGLLIADGSEELIDITSSSTSAGREYPNFKTSITALRATRNWSDDA